MIHKIYGHIEVYRCLSKDLLDRELVYSRPNAIYITMQTRLRDVLINRSIQYGVDAIAWGSFYNPAGTFVDSDWSGTTSAGTKGALIQSAVGSIQAKFSGTFSFSSTKQINYFQLGQGYQAAGGGISSLFSSLYNYDNSLLTGSTFLTYNNGDSLIVDWTNQMGS